MTRARVPGLVSPHPMGERQNASGDFVPPSGTPLLVGDVGGASGASLRVRSRRPGSREDGLTHRAEPKLTAAMLPGELEGA